MRAVITLAIAGAVTAALSYGFTTALRQTPSVQAHRQVTPTEFDDMWDTGNPNRRVCRHNKRKCVEVASNIAYNMARSGAYADLNDDQFAQLATRVAAHIVDSVYDHDETSPLDP